jgi:hypothetical protein
MAVALERAKPEEETRRKASHKEAKKLEHIIQNLYCKTKSVLSNWFFKTNKLQNTFEYTWNYLSKEF